MFDKENAMSHEGNSKS